MICVQETTKWGEHPAPNHIYLLDDSKQKMFGYVKAGTKELKTFAEPLRFDARRRTFKAVPNTFDVKEEEVLTPQWKVAGSKGNTYTVEYISGDYVCSCTGYGFRGKCKHIDQVKGEIA